MKIYGIKNCNSVKKSLEYFKNVNYEFLDIKKIDENILNDWLKQKTLMELVNTKGITAKKLNINKDNISKIDDLKYIILQNLSIIKRPIIEYKNKIYIGKEYEEINL